MRYAVIKKEVASTLGIETFGHLSNGEQIVISEKELMSVTAISGTVEDRANAVGAAIYSLSDIKDIIKRRKFK